MRSDSSSRDTVVPLSRFRAIRGRPSGHRQLDALLEAADPAAAVAALSVAELYYLVAEVGLDDCAELVALAAPEQIRGCLDLDIWDRDRVQLEAAWPWLAAVLAAGYEPLGRLWENLDPELCALIIARGARVHDLSLDEAPDPADERPVFTTPDTFFAVEFTSEDPDDVALLHQLLDHLYRADAELARHTLMTARSELRSELEEMSYRWRSGRMADLGYVEFYDALEVFRPLDTGAVRIGEETAEPAMRVEPGDGARAPRGLPVPLIEVAFGRAFLADALNRITDAAEASRLESALVLLINKVMSASRVSPGDVEALAAGTAHAAATLALGLETVAGGDPDRAVAALRTVSLVRLHRVGYTLTLKLARLARRLAPRAGAAGEPAASILSALGGARPWFPAELDDPPRADIRPFESMADVRAVADALAVLALRIAIAGSFGVDPASLAAAPAPGDAHGAAPRAPAAPGEPPELDDIARTALLRCLAGGELAFAPASRAEIDAFRRRAVAGGAPTDTAQAAAVAALSAHLDRAGVEAGREHLPAITAGWLRDIADATALLTAGADADARFVTGVVIARDAARP